MSRQNKVLPHSSNLHLKIKIKEKESGQSKTTFKRIFMLKEKCSSNQGVNVSFTKERLKIVFRPRSYASLFFFQIFKRKNQCL